MDFNSGATPGQAERNRTASKFDSSSVVWDIQRYEGGKNFNPRVGGGTGFSLGWSAVRNRDVYRGGARSLATATVFLDPDKAPLKK